MDSLEDYPAILTFLPGDWTDPPIPDMMIDRMREHPDSIVVGIHDYLIARRELGFHDVQYFGITNSAYGRRNRDFLKTTEELYMNVESIIPFEKIRDWSFRPSTIGSVFLEVRRGGSSGILAAQAIIETAHAGGSVSYETWRRLNSAANVPGPMDELYRYTHAEARFRIGRPLHPISGMGPG